MKGKEITILGAGISGLALGYYLRQKHPNATISAADCSFAPMRGESSATGR